MKNKVVILITILIISLAGYTENANDKKIVALEKKLSHVKGRQKVDVLNKLVYLLIMREPARAVSYFDQALDVAKKFNYIKGRADALLIISEYYQNVNDYKKSKEYLFEALSLYKKMNNESKIIITLFELGQLYFSNANMDEALKYYLQSLKRLEETRAEIEFHKKWKIFYRIGILYLNIKMNKKALGFFIRSLKIAEKEKDKQFIAYSLNNIGINYKNLEEYHKALEYYKKALKIFTEIKQVHMIAGTLLNIGILNMELNHYKEASKYLYKALNTYQELKYDYGSYLTSYHLGNLHLKENNTKEALSYYNLALEKAEKKKDKKTHANIFKQFSELYTTTGEYKKALEYYKKYSELKDTIINEEKSKTIAKLQEQYEAVKRDKEIKMLKQKNKIETIYRNAAIIISILLIIIFIQFFRKFQYLFFFWKKKNYIGHYRVMEKIASGGMGTVYKAHDIKDKTRILAIKVLREEYYTDEDYKKRFKNEAAIIDQLMHPNIIKVVERGEYDENLYIAMELLEGKSLAQWLNEKEWLDLDIALNIMRQVSDALVEIHKKKIIHRDLKPENIMLIEKKENPHHVKLLDFGLAKTQNLTRMTQTGKVIGSIYHIAPEQITHAQVTSASDIYSLGVVYYQILSGERPFIGDTVSDIAYQIIEKEPLEPSKFRTNIPGELNQLVVMMMAKDPKKRPLAEEVLNVLNNIKV